MIYIHQHLGLGDHFVTKGLLKALQKRYQDTFGVFVKHHNVPTVTQLLSDLEAEIIPVSGDHDAHKISTNNILYIGFCPDLIHLYGWESAFYKQHTVDYKERWNSWTCPRDISSEEALEKELLLPEKYVFVVDTCSNGTINLPISSSFPQVRLEKLTNNLLDWRGVIEKAEEVHLVDSSVFQLIKQLPFYRRKIFYDVRSKGIAREPYTISPEWEEIIL